VVIYIFIRFLQETRGSGVFKGFVVMTVILVFGSLAFVETLDLQHLRFIAASGLQIFLISLVVIFHPELRQAMVKLGESRILRTLTRDIQVRSTAQEIRKAAERLSRRKLGAIMIIERRVGITGFTEGGVQMDAIVSAPLIVSLFFDGTPLHDGAIVIQGSRIVAAGCVLPLSENPRLSKSLGTRHRASLGVTEESDCIAVVVSEETSNISVAIRGEFEIDVTPERLEVILEVTGEEDE
jgi:diadenylate cyclase